MANSRWTLDPDIDAFPAMMEPPPAPFMQQLMAERTPLGPFRMNAVEAWYGALLD